METPQDLGSEYRRRFSPVAQYRERVWRMLVVARTLPRAPATRAA